MLTIQEFSTSINNGHKAITTVYLGNEYTLIQTRHNWRLWTRRLSLGQAGSVKRFATLAEVAKSCKAFGNVEQIISLAYGV